MPMLQGLRRDTAKSRSRESPDPELPDLADNDTIVVKPGDDLASVNETALSPIRWQTVVFAPGVHRVATPFPNGFTVLTQAQMTRYFFCDISFGFSIRPKGRNSDELDVLLVGGFNIKTDGQ